MVKLRAFRDAQSMLDPMGQSGSISGRATWFLLALLAIAGCSGCSATAWQALAQGLSSAGPSPQSYTTHKTMIFGGPGHETYLGCLSCSEFAVDSVFNEHGAHGSQYRTNSVHNPYGQFGSPYSTYSACNPYATDPPVIVDEEGNFYGRLTVNRYHSQATKNEELIRWLEDIVCE